VLFVDHLSPSESLSVRPILQDLEKEYAEALSKGQARPLEDVMARLKELEVART